MSTRLLGCPACLPSQAAMTFVDSIVSGCEQKRRFVFTHSGGGAERREGERVGGRKRDGRLVLVTTSSWDKRQDSQKTEC